MAAADLPLLTFEDAPATWTRLAAQPTGTADTWLRLPRAGAPEATASKADVIDCVLGGVLAYAVLHRAAPARTRAARLADMLERGDALLPRRARR